MREVEEEVEVSLLPSVSREQSSRSQPPRLWISVVRRIEGGAPAVIATGAYESWLRAWLLGALEWAVDAVSRLFVSREDGWVVAWWVERSDP